jgi:hypothetical protein
MGQGHDGAHCFQPLAPWLYVHLLNGSSGTTVDSLVERYKPPEYGALRGLGFKRVKALVNAAHVEDESGGKKESDTRPGEPAPSAMAAVHKSCDGM